MAQAVAIVPYLMAAGSAVSMIGQYNAAQYQAAVLQNNANLAAENNQREAQAMAEDMMDRDTDARAAIGALIAEMSASGIDGSSGSMLLRRQGQQGMADRDRNRLAVKRDTQIENNLNEIEGLKAEAKATVRNARFGLLSGAAQVATSYLSGASLVNDYKRSSYGLSKPSYQGR